MQALIDMIVRHFMALWPIARVYSWQQGLRIRGGIMMEELGPGLHWRIPLYDEVYRVNSTLSPLDLKASSIMTLDGKSYIVSANMDWRITSIKLMWANVTTADGMLANASLGFLAREISKRTTQQVEQQITQIELDLAAELAKEFTPYGIKVEKVFITDMAPAKQFRLFNDNNWTK